MKRVTCRQMGGLCDKVLAADSYDGIMKVGMEHLEKAHPEMAADIKGLSKDDPKMLKWEREFRKTWDSLPEVKRAQVVEEETSEEM